MFSIEFIRSKLYSFKILELLLLLLLLLLILDIELSILLSWKRGGGVGESWIRECEKRENPGIKMIRELPQSDLLETDGAGGSESDEENWAVGLWNYSEKLDKKKKRSKEKKENRWKDKIINEWVWKNCSINGNWVCQQDVRLIKVGV